jgi:hypothetical protein
MQALREWSLRIIGQSQAWDRISEKELAIEKFFEDPARVREGKSEGRIGALGTLFYATEDVVFFWTFELLQSDGGVPMISELTCKK